MRISDWSSDVCSSDLNATGLYITGGGTAGDGTLTNQGVLSVATQSSAGGARAIGMDVEQGTSATLISQRTGATGGMTVTGGLATGFLVNNVTGPVSVSNSGYIVDVSSTTGDPVSGVVVTSGSSETVRFADAVVGGTD